MDLAVGSKQMFMLKIWSKLQGVYMDWEKDNLNIQFKSSHSYLKKQLESGGISGMS